MELLIVVVCFVSVSDVCVCLITGREENCCSMPGPCTAHSYQVVRVCVVCACSVCVRACVCMCGVWGGVCVHVCMCVRVREHVCVCVVSVYVSVHACMSLCVCV